MIRKTFGILAIGVITTGLAAFAQDTPKQEMKKAGSDAKDAAKSAGKSTKHAAKGVAKGTKKGVHKTAAATENTAAKVKDKTKQ